MGYIVGGGTLQKYTRTKEGTDGLGQLARAPQPLVFDIRSPHTERAVIVAECEPGSAPWSDASDPTPDVARTVNRLGDNEADASFIQTEPGQLLLVRSVAGRVPLYFADFPGRPGCVAVSTTLDGLFQHIPLPPLDEFVTALWTAVGTFPDRRTFFRGVSCVPRGHYASFGSSGWKTTEYWHPDGLCARAASAADREHRAQRTREELLSTLARELPPTQPSLLTSSGGVDSSAIGAIASGHLQREVHTYTLFASGSETAKRDLPYLQSLEDGSSFSTQWSSRNGYPHRVALLKHAPKVPFPIGHPALCALPFLKAQTGAAALIGGEWADEVLGGRIMTPDWTHHASAGDHVRALLPRFDSSRAAYTVTLRAIFRKLSRRWVTAPPPIPPALPRFIRPALRAEYESWRRELTYRHLNSEERWPLLRFRLNVDDGFLAMNWEACTKVGVRRVIPFLSRNLIRRTLDSHPADHMSPGKADKQVLREALKGLAPDLNVYRQDKGWAVRADRGKAARAGVQPPMDMHPNLSGVLAAEWMQPPSGAGPVNASQLWLLQQFAFAISGSRSAEPLERQNELIQRVPTWHTMKP